MPTARENSIRRVAKQLTKRHMRNFSYAHLGPAGIRTLVHHTFISAGINTNKSHVNKALPNSWFEVTNFNR
jgi:hypothetical protein